MRIALVRRANVVAKHLRASGVDVRLGCVVGNYYERDRYSENYEGMEISFFGQAHFREFGERKIPISMFIYIKECFKTVSRVLKYIEDEEISDIVIFTTLPVSLLLALRLNTNKVNLFYDVDDFTSEQWEKSNPIKYMLASLFSFAEKIIPNKAKVSTCSEYLASFYSQPTVISNMVELKYFSGITLEEKHALYDDRTIEVIFLSEIGPYHGHKEIIEAIDTHRALLEGRFHFTFVGGGYYYGAIREAITAHGLDRFISMTGRLEFEEVLPYLKRASVGLLPLTEAKVNLARNPLKLFEYMISGVLVIASPAPEVTNIAKDEKHAFLARDFSAQALIDRLLEAYEKIDGWDTILSSAYEKALCHTDDVVIHHWRAHLEITDD